MSMQGFSYLVGGKLGGKSITGAAAGQLGLAKAGQWPSWMQPVEGGLPLAPNLVLDTGRQYALYALGGKTPTNNYIITHFGVGTGTTAPTTGDTALEAPITLSNGTTKKLVDSIDFPSPFNLRVNYTLGLADANGYLVTEVGFYAGDGTLLIRATRLGLSKISSWAPTMAHTVSS